MTDLESNYWFSEVKALTEEEFSTLTSEWQWSVLRSAESQVFEDEEDSTSSTYRSRSGRRLQWATAG